MTGTPGGDPLARRPFGPTGLEVSPLCLGCAPLGDMPRTFTYSVPEERALATIRALLDSPINFLDTAASYGDGGDTIHPSIIGRWRGREQMARIGHWSRLSESWVASREYHCAAG